jgi:hypothetical protein
MAFTMKSPTGFPFPPSPRFAEGFLPDARTDIRPAFARPEFLR